MPTLTLRGIHCYPIKSAAGLTADRWEVDRFGLRHDRRWMLVDPKGRLITQRERPGLALIRPSIRGETLLVEGPGMASLELPLRPRPAVRTMVQVWDDSCSAAWLGPEAAAWFSQVLDTPCSLVYMPEDTVRPIAHASAPPDGRVSFADAFPFLLLSEESLAELNRRLPAPLPMNRFRPNLVIAGGEPHEEDRLGSFHIGGIGFRVAKPCARCVLTTVDQATGRRGREPLRTLATYRREGGAVLFGQNLAHRGTGELRVGEVLRR
jgi:uncharacterized protein YcbX